MSKGAVLDELLVQEVGLADQLFTLTGPIENRHHPVLGEPLFEIKTKEIPETVYLDRKYVFEHQVSIKGNYGAGERVLLWMSRQLRPNPHHANAPPVSVLTAREIFLMNEWKEFQRFKQFIKSMRIRDAQARQWLTDHHAEIPALLNTEEGCLRVIGVLGAINDWPDPDVREHGPRSSSIELLAKTWSRSLAPLRSAPHFPMMLLRPNPDVRFNVFRLMSFVEDPVQGATGLVRFLHGVGTATCDPELVAQVKELKTSRDLARSFAALRVWLLSGRMPPAGA